MNQSFAKPTGDLELARSKRRRTMLTAHVEVGGSQIDARVRNLSQTGALIETKAGLKIGMPVLLRRAGAEVAAVVARVQQGAAGLQGGAPGVADVQDVRALAGRGGGE